MLFALLVNVALAATPAATPPVPDATADGPSTPADAVDLKPTDAWMADAHAREQQLLDLVKQGSPDRYAELMTLRASDPGAYFVALEKVSRMAEMANDPEAVKRYQKIQVLEGMIQDLISQYPGETTDQRAKTRTQAVDLAGQLFDLKQEERRSRLAQMQARLQDLQGEIDDRDSRRDAIIARWVDQQLDVGGDL